MLNAKYDADKKENFLKSLEDKYNPGTIALYQSTLNKLDIAEEMYGTSICDANHDTRVAMVSECMSVDDYFNRATISRIRDYLLWCQENGYTTFDPLDIAYVPSKSSAIHLKYFMSWDEFEDYLDINMRPDSDESVDIMYRIYAELIFLGFGPYDVPYIKKSDVNWQDSTISSSGYTAKIPDSVMRRIALDAQLDGYIVVRSHRVGKRLKNKTDYLINIMGFSGGENRDGLYTYMMQRIARINKVYEYKHTSPFDIFMSGVMLRAYALAEGQYEYIYGEYSRVHVDIKKAVKIRIANNYDSWVIAKRIMDC